MKLELKKTIVIPAVNMTKRTKWSVKQTISIKECPKPHGSKRKPLSSPFREERKEAAKLIRPGTTSTLQASE